VPNTERRINLENLKGNGVNLGPPPLNVNDCINEESMEDLERIMTDMQASRALNQ
jgi:hypothetical protein